MKLYQEEEEVIILEKMKPYLELMIISSLLKKSISTN